MKRALIMLLAAPLVICLYSYVVYLSWEYENNGLFVIGFVPLGFTFYYILIASIILLIMEWRARRKNKHIRTTPSAWIILAAVILSATISVGACFLVIIPWADAIASV